MTEPHPDDLDAAWERAYEMDPDTRIRNRSALSAILIAVADNQLRRRMDAISAAREEMEPGKYPEEQPVNEPADAGEEALRKALQPFADAVFNDNGDISVNLAAPTHDDFVNAYFALKGQPRSQ